MSELRTQRLVLRQWQEADRAAYAALNADPEVRRYFPGLMTRAESDAQMQSFMQGIESRGWGFWAVELASSGQFMGMLGLHPIDMELPGPASVEIGWRLAKQFWGHGYATEGARAALCYARDSLKLPDLAAFTAVENQASRRVMEKLGMQHRPEWDFDHPRLSPGHRLERHVYYWIEFSA